MSSPLSRPQSELHLARGVAPVIEQMLGDGHSSIVPDVKIWTPEVAEELRHRIEDNPLTGKRDQWSKLSEQLTGAPEAVILLAAELVLLRDHAERTLTLDTRVKHLKKVLALAGIDALPEWLGQMLKNREHSGFKGGQGYHGALWKQLIWLAKFVVHLRSQDMATREAARGDAWEFQRLMLDIEEDTSGIRNALQYLAFPEVFEPIASNAKKTKIRRGFADRITQEPGDDPYAVDRDLLEIRRVLAQEHDAPFHFWSPGIIEQWSDTPAPDAAEADEDSTRGVHYWAFAPGASASNWDCLLYTSDAADDIALV